MHMFKNRFEERFGDMQSEEQVRILQRRLEPFLLRRVKEDVGKNVRLLFPTPYQ